ncbi:hypothetical protein AEM42_10375 [Betaproteobacteria bacterium UKL13-2]|nr:hypothetical protein AEM42_10375 [Betaproteobacteria bacterium UKL13-2]
MQYAYSIYLVAAACQYDFICCMHIAYERKTIKIIFWKTPLLAGIFKHFCSERQAGGGLLKKAQCYWSGN